MLFKGSLIFANENINLSYLILLLSLTGQTVFNEDNVVVIKFTWNYEYATHEFSIFFIDDFVSRYFITLFSWDQIINFKKMGQNVKILM